MCRERQPKDGRYLQVVAEEGECVSSQAVLYTHRLSEGSVRKNREHQLELMKTLWERPAPGISTLLSPALGVFQGLSSFTSRVHGRHD
jgi:hypothetical protein